MTIVKASRQPISKKLRFDVFKRDGFSCQYCGKHPPDITLEIDHIMPVAEGGNNEIENLLAACFDCNRGKGRESLSVIPKTVAERTEEIREQEAQLAGYREALSLRQSRIDDEQWLIATALFQQSAAEGIRRDWLRSISKFNEILGYEQVLEAVWIAIDQGPIYSEKRLFAYFCGICWNKIRSSCR